MKKIGTVVKPVTQTDSFDIKLWIRKGIQWVGGENKRKELRIVYFCNNRQWTLWMDCTFLIIITWRAFALRKANQSPFHITYRTIDRRRVGCFVYSIVFKYKVSSIAENRRVYSNYGIRLWMAWRATSPYVYVLRWVICFGAKGQ